MKYRTCVIVDAFKWTGDESQTEDPEWLVKMIEWGHVTFDGVGTSDLHMHINQPDEVPLVVRPGEYVIRGITGLVFSRKDAEFWSNYEPVSDEA